LGKIAEAALHGVDFIQLREKDLSVRDLEVLAAEAVHAVRKAGAQTRLLINSRTDVAIASQADGVHLRSTDVSPQQIRSIHRSLSSAWGPDPVVGVSCHNPEEVKRAAENAASFAVLAPVFEKPGSHPAGLEMLARACRESIRVLALGGVTLENAPACLQAGAAGVAGIRLFQNGDLAKTVAVLRSNARSQTL